MRRILLSIWAGGLFLGVADASACSFPQSRSDREIAQTADQAFASASAIIDGEVVSPMNVGPDLPDGVLPVAYIKVLHAWKGHPDDDFATVVYSSSCDVILATEGQKIRILLNGSGIFTANQEMNGAAAYNHDIFNREIDRLIGASRPADFSDPVGPPPPQK